LCGGGPVTTDLCGRSMLSCRPQRPVCTLQCRLEAGTVCRRLPLAATLTAAALASPAAPIQGSIPGSIESSVCVDTTPSGLRGLWATRHVEKGGLLLSMPITHVLAVPNWLCLQAVGPWQTNYVAAFEQQWQAPLPKGLLEVLSGTDRRAPAAAAAARSAVAGLLYYHPPLSGSASGRHH
jgi:hypothetical protein